MPRKQTFAASVNAYVRKASHRMEAVFKQSVQEVAIQANVPVAQGGNMRVDTGFLRNSQVAALNEEPSGPSKNGDDPQGNPDADVAMVISQASVGDVIWVGWSANYARHREYQDGFLDSALQDWQKIVRRNAARAKKLGI